MTMVNNLGLQDASANWIPLDWKVSRLKNLCSIITKGTTPTTLGFSYQPTGVNFIKVESIDGYGNIQVKKLAHISVEAHNSLERSKLADGDIIYSIAGAIGRSAIIKEEHLPANTNQALAIIRPIKTIDNSYLRFSLSSEAQRNHIALISVSSAQANISLKDVSSFLVPVPPIGEQRKIAAILSAVDDKLDVISRLFFATKKLKHGLMQNLFSQGIGAQDTKGRWLQHSDFKRSELGMIPVIWRADKINSHALKVGSGSTPKGGSNVYLTSGIPLVRSQNVLVGCLSLDDIVFISDEQHKKMRNSKLSPNDVLLNITGASIGRCAILPADFREGNVNQHVCIIRTAPSLNPKYLSHYLNSNAGQKQVDKFQAGGNREGLNFQQIRSFDLPLPPVSEQEKIAQILDGVDSKLDALTIKLSHYQTLKRGLMQKLLTGEWRVKIDEPTPTTEQ